MALPVGNTTFQRLGNAFGGGMFLDAQLQGLADELDFIVTQGAQLSVRTDLNVDPLGVWNQVAGITRNTMAGAGAGVNLDNTGLGWNTFFGYLAGQQMVGNVNSGSPSGENTFIGTLAGQFQPSGSFNTYVGNVTGWGINYDCSNNTYIGMDVFRGSPELTPPQWNAGTNNTGVGAAVMRNGSFNKAVALGTNAMHFFNTTGNLVSIIDSVAIGFTAMAGDSTCTGTIQHCITIGSLSGSDLGKNSSATVDGNTFVGQGTGKNVTTGSWNTLLGYNAGSSTSALSIVFTTLVGANTGTALTSAAQLTAIGYGAARFLTSGNANTFVGYLSGGAVIGGSFNTFVGQNSGASVTSGTTNTILGPLCGSTNLVTGSNNILVGYALDTVGDASATINIGNTFLATIAGGPASNGHITLAGIDVAFSNSVFTSTAVGVSFDVAYQLVTNIAVLSGGTGYATNDTVHDANGGRYSVTSQSGGVITGLSIIKPGIATGAPPATATLTNGSKTASSNQTGAGATATMTYSANSVLQLNKSASDVIISSGGLAASAVIGFLGLPGGTLTPTGVPANASLAAGMGYYNKTSHTWNVYDGSGWNHVTLSAGAA